MKLNEKQIKKIREEAKQYMNEKNEGQGAKEILSKMYLGAFPDEGKQKAEQMADEALSTIEKFEANYAEITKDTERFLNRFQDEAEAGKTDAEKCDMWLEFIAAVSAAAAPGKTEAQRKAIYEELARMPAAKPTPELAQHLREQARKVLENNPVLLMHLEQHAGDLEELEQQMSTDEAARVLMSLNDDEGELSAVAAMLTYIKIRQGEFGGAGKDMTLGQVAALVCAAHMRVSILERLHLGEIAEKTAVVLLDLLGMVLILTLGVIVFTKACKIAVNMFSVIVAVPIVLLTIVSVYTIMNKGIDEWLKATDTIVKVTGVLLKNVLHGAYKLAKYAAKVVLPKLAEAAPKVLGKVYSVADGLFCQTMRNHAQAVKA